jgi:hypothetical protein
MGWNVILNRRKSPLESYFNLSNIEDYELRSGSPAAGAICAREGEIGRLISPSTSP